MSKKGKLYRELYDAATIGLSVVFSILIGGAIGYFLDKKYHTPYHWVFFLFLFMGIVAGFRNMYKGAKRVERNEGETEDNDKKT